MKQVSFHAQVTYTNYGSSDFLHVHVGARTSRQCSSSPLYTPPIPPHISSWSSASLSSDVCWRHILDASFHVTLKGTEVTSMHTGWICKRNFVTLPHHGLCESHP